MVDFLKLMTPEQREKFARNREYLAKEKAEHAAMGAHELVVRALHDWHNSSCTGHKGMNGYGPADCVYDAALVFRVLPELIERLAKSAALENSEHEELYKKICAHRRGDDRQAIKCPCKGCTGYVELP